MELARRVEACACYTSGVADMLRPYIAVEKLFVARNTLDLAPMMAQHEELRAEGRESVRRRLSIPARSRVLVYLGRLIPEKGVDLLLEAYRKLSADSQVVLLVVGDGPERARMESETRRQGLDDVRYLGALFGQDAAPFLFSSDVMVVPGYLGLVINHAFAFGLPVVSMRNPIGTGGHSPEVEYLESGETGVLCDGVTVDDLVRGIKSVLNDRPRYSANAYAYARAHLTLEQMVDGLHAAILHAGGD
ncbi:MAG: glycosyltransferase family 4 protein [Rhodothermales bacterium]